MILPMFERKQFRQAGRRRGGHLLVGVDPSFEEIEEGLGGGFGFLEEVLGAHEELAYEGEVADSIGRHVW